MITDDENFSKMNIRNVSNASKSGADIETSTTCQRMQTFIVPFGEWEKNPRL